MRISAGMFLALAAASSLPAEPHTERRTYAVEWRLVRAGTVTLEYGRSHAIMRLESSGIVSSLFKVEDTYEANYQDGNCATTSIMDSKEGKRHHDTRITYDGPHNRAYYVERDLLKNAILHQDNVEIPSCVSDVFGALLKLRETNLELGQTVQVPMSDGRKYAAVKIQAQEREEVKTPFGNYPAIRYEADIMNGVVYTRKGKVNIWLTDDQRKLAVQIRLRMGFPVGAVTLQLEKAEHLGNP
jgi:hypothetical protein